jgi:hypothetical protein
MGFPHPGDVSPSALKAPNINFAKEVYDLRLMRNTVEAIFIAPKLQRPRGKKRGMVDGLLMVYSCLFFIGCLLIFIYIY